ncbi:MAG: PEP-CTERM sorting domain-containing protein [bacterium]|nr:PEP-CTERM sorting domain-containing protein [bacterium]
MNAERSIAWMFAGMLVCSGVATAQPLVIVDDQPGAFIDISVTGTALGLGEEDETIYSTAIGNTVLPAGDIVIANNGGVGFDNPPDTNLAPLNAPLPSNSAFGGGQALLAFWDDIGNTMGDIYVREDADRLIIQWHDRQFADSEDTSRFQIQIFDETTRAGCIYAQFLYADIEQPRAGGGASATIGYQDDGAGFGDVQWSFDTANDVDDGMVLTLMCPEPGTAFLVGLGGLAVWRRQR